MTEERTFMSYGLLSAKKPYTMGLFPQKSPSYMYRECGSLSAKERPIILNVAYVFLFLGVEFCSVPLGL